jgi:hypothetical protein
MHALDGVFQAVHPLDVEFHERGCVTGRDDIAKLIADGLGAIDDKDAPVPLGGNTIAHGGAVTANRRDADGRVN